MKAVLGIAFGLEHFSNVARRVGLPAAGNLKGPLERGALVHNTLPFLVEQNSSCNFFVVVLRYQVKADASKGANR